MNEAILYLHLVLGVLIFTLLAAGRVRQWRGLSVTAAVAVLVSGAHNFAVRMAYAPRGWHALAGIKVLLALHVLAMVLLLARGGTAEKERRWRRSALVSGAITMGIGLYLSNFLR